MKVVSFRTPLSVTVRPRVNRGTHLPHPSALIRDGAHRLLSALLSGVLPPNGVTSAAKAATLAFPRRRLDHAEKVAGNIHNLALVRALNDASASEPFQDPFRADPSDAEDFRR